MRFKLVGDAPARAYDVARITKRVKRLERAGEPAGAGLVRDLERRIRRLERRHEALLRGHSKLYHQAYARLKRRSGNESRALARAGRLEKSCSVLFKNGGMLRHIAKILGNLGRGRSILSLNNRQRQRLTYLLRAKNKGYQAIRGPRGMRHVMLTEEKIRVLRALLVRHESAN